MIELAIDDPRWFDFVAGRREALPFHHPAWASVLAECYGYRAFALAQVEDSGRIVAGLPIIEIGRLTGAPRWISMPFTDEAPPLVADDSALDGLVEALNVALREADVTYLEVRAGLRASAVSVCSDAVVHRMALSDEPQEMLRAFRHSHVGRNIQKARREGVEVVVAESAADLTKTFYGLHVQTRRRQGVPVQPRRFFRELWKTMIEPGLGYVLLAYAEGRPIAGAVFLTWNGTMTYKFGASDTRYWSLRPNNLLFWEAISWGCSRGYRTFDLGRTDLSNQGLRAFKDAWGATEEPLLYSYLGGEPRRRSGGPARRTLKVVIRRSPALVCRLVGELFYRYAA